MGFQLTIEPLGETIELEEGERLLDGCLRAGIQLPYACHHGLCGTCKVQVLEGEVAHCAEASPFALMDIERDEGKCLACASTLLSDCIIEADVDEEPDACNYPVHEFTARVAEVIALTPTVRGITLELADGLAFQAGQYLNLHVPGVAGPRAFSIASSPSRAGQLDLHIRKVEGGAATRWLCDELVVGDSLRVTGPLGRFFVRHSSPEPLLFLAGGTGLSSPRAMVLERLEAGDARPLTLIHGVRAQEELYLEEEFRELAARHSNFEYIPAVSGDAPAWQGERGLVHEVAMRRFGGRFEGLRAYLCGPPAMIDACLAALMQGRLFERDIFVERFFTQADGVAGAARSPLFKRL